MTTVILQGARKAAPFLLKTAKNVAITYANQALSNVLNPQSLDGPRLETLHIQTSRDGAPMARIFGRTRLAGQVIWASQVKEHVTTRRQGSGKGGPKRTDYSYTISFAVGLCEGEITDVERIWANGEPLDMSRLTLRIHKGNETQQTDPLIAMIDGEDAPGFRGTAYIVFEDFPLDDFGARLPQINVEITRAPKASHSGARLETKIKAINLIPSSGEFVYATTPIDDVSTLGQSHAININNVQGFADCVLAIDQLQGRLPNCKQINIVVSWFGDDLRAGQCSIRPGVESRERRTAPQNWEVSTFTRETAQLISRLDDKPVYGGTPSDESLKALITLLKTRGFKVAIYPFILMDIDLAKGQPAFPWRGRITAEAQDDTAQAAAEIDSFYQSYRSMIVHYAALTASIGGVDSFIIGSELRGLTTVRGPNHAYPFVAHLQALAAEVRSNVGPDCGLTYAADWSEYFGHHSGDDVLFHLDSLWADSNIDAVGIDAYFSLSDWRDGEMHMDVGQGGPHDLEYLTSQIEGGEGFDYFYGSRAERNAQIRTPITDGAYNKPWVYRYKDMRNWWKHPHYNRINGIEASAPTAWQPQSKPIWLTEIGCPAVDKGSNQPNVFCDPKSAESSLPYYSNGARDDYVQRRYLDSLLSYWEVATGHNPVSIIYGGPMISPDQIAPWCWDARPFPDFPARRHIWSDGDNWARGHWLSGRMGSAQLGDIVSEIVRSSGAPAPDVTGLSGFVSGYRLDRPMSARAALEPLARAYGFSGVQRPEGLKFFHYEDTALTTLTPLNIAASSDDGAPEIRRADIEDLLQDVRLHFIDIDNDHQSGMVSARNRLSQSVDVTDISAPLGLSAQQAKTLAVTILQRAQWGSRSANFTLMPGEPSLYPGDIITLPQVDGYWQIETLDGLTERRVRAVSVRLQDGPLRELAVSVPSELPPIITPSRPVIHVLDIPHLGELQERAGPLIAAYCEPWSPVRVSGPGGYVDIEAPSPVGTLLNDIPAGPIGRLDYSAHIDVFVQGDTLASRPLIDILSGHNALTICTGETWEVLQFQRAHLIAPDQYRLSGLLRGLGASRAAPIASGAEIVFLGGQAHALPLPANYRGETISLTAASLARPQAETQTFIYEAAHLTPLAPAHLKARRDGAEIHLTWIRQTRLGGDDWNSINVPLAAAHERYVVSLRNETEGVIESLNVTQPTCEFPLSIFQSAHSISVAQISDRIGPGVAITVLTATLI